MMTKLIASAIAGINDRVERANLEVTAFRYRTMTARDRLAWAACLSEDEALAVETAVVRELPPTSSGALRAGLRKLWVDG